MFRCTRWFLPLVILPLPTAPPIFLLVFLLSLTLCARPCFYCIVLLTALFTSSCYWQPLPIDTPLLNPIGNATTFAEAVRANLSTPPSTFPPVIQLLDRCWCNAFAASGFFEPADTSAWELASVRRMQRSLELAAVKEADDAISSEERMQASDTSADDEPASEEGKDFTMQKESNDSAAGATILAPAAPHKSTRPLLFHRLRNFVRPKTSSESVPSPSATVSKEVQISQSSIPEPAYVASEAVTMETAFPGQPPPILRRYYDLRPYGLDVTVDFGWSR
ncbi:hypothetical protein M0805_004568 [Coniferiporia weirii]|nr:hypothetical protein M0805_004568 [Coniferiporia weirii]